ncbi:coenzyme F420-0:L-glutamate ligase / coenzyme F420-1:gamma-L-glutamate ligase [Cohaesibacter sp. ES.047]|uniref:coenzyme F420-0:L-glutamate ligase n=1 Tax=Cohaesibacter sp. ES.047 TaxID=1798205 RepID=UPI000BB814C3|nr:coenzyme F420-0:L-glutamate ligase [Cohaesibacter sp. ES.047]SNY92975.1 coenzyme F420-0:L-glutamate ligase / coenzyme F420-1:gamma-L-glutamate ligase [Cohaesibacter sp. ES.047]
MMQVSLSAIPGVPDIRAGDDLASIIGDCLVASDLAPQDGDILCVAQKVFSKAEDCIIPLASITPSPEAERYASELNKDARKVEIVLRESSEVVRSFRHPGQEHGTIICRHRLGFISANAAVDESNFEETDAVMTLPPDPDASVARLQDALKTRFGCEVGVVMTDTFGRPWRIGQVNVAIGLSGVPSTLREQGNADAWGRVMTVTEAAFADELAAASGLVVRKAAKTPIVLFRGLDWIPTTSSAQDLLRVKKEDMFK